MIRAGGGGVEGRGIVFRLTGEQSAHRALNGCAHLQKSTTYALHHATARRRRTDGIVARVRIVVASVMRRHDLSAPVPEIEPTEEHAAEMSEMRNVPVREEGREHLNERIADHEILRFHGDGRKEQHDTLFGKGHAKRQEHTIARTARPDRHPRIEISIHRDDLHAVGHHRIPVEPLYIILP